MAIVAVPVLSVALTLALELPTSRTKPADPRPAAEDLRRAAALVDHRDVPFAALLATPERYEGRKVWVQGFLTIEFEDTALHPTREAWEALQRSNALMIEAPAWVTRAQMKGLSRHYASVAGTFTTKTGPEFGYPAGALRNIQSLHRETTRAEFDEYFLQQRLRFMDKQFLSAPFLAIYGWLALVVIWLIRSSLGLGRR